MEVKEFKKKISEVVYTVMKSGNVVEYNDYALQEEIRELIMPLINQFKKEVCKKQRSLCGEIYNDSTNRWELEVMEKIENADEPK